MNCNYCESKAQYAFAGGECMCAMCLASLPSDMVSARAEVARLRDELAAVTVQRDELLKVIDICANGLWKREYMLELLRGAIAKCEVQPIEPVIGLSPCAYDAGEGVQIQACQNASGVMWAIRKNGEVLGKAGYWDYEPMPSQRDKEFLTDFRFGSHVEAAKCLAEYRKGEVKNDA